MSHYRAYLVCFLIASSHAIGASQIAEHVLQKLEARKGYVIKGIEEEKQEIYVDLGISDGVEAGDLLTVLGADKVIVHPVSGVEVARIPSNLAVLGVTRSFQDFSIAKILTGSNVETGDSISSFTALSASFVDKAGNGEVLYHALRDSLPELEWQGYSHDESNQDYRNPGELVFVLSLEQLNIYYGQSWLVTSLPRSSSSASDSNASLPASAAMNGTTGSLRVTNPLAPKQITPVPFAAIAADFVAYADQQLLASGTEDSLRLAIVAASEISEYSTIPIPHRNRLLALQWWQPDPRELPLLAVTTWDDGDVEGMLFRPVDGKLEIVQLNLPYILGAFDLDGDGQREALLGQRFDRKGFFGRSIRRLKLNEDQLQASEPRINLPTNFPVLSSAITDLTGDGKPEFAVIRDRKLSIYSTAGEKMYVYDEDVGTGLSILTYDLTPSREFSPIERAHFDPAPMVLREKGRPQLLITTASYPQFSVPGIDSAAKQSRLTSVRYQDNRFVHRSVAETIDQPVLAVALDANRLLLLSSNPQKKRAASSQGGSRILSIPLPQ